MDARNPPSPKLTVLSTLAVKGVLDSLREHRALHRVAELQMTYAPTAVLLPRISEGARADIGLLTSEAVDQLIMQGVMAGLRVDLAVSSIGVAVRSGAAQPDISSVESFVRALRAAESIVYSRTGASGIYFADLLHKLGLTEEVNEKATVIASGFTGEVTARGEAELAIQQISELQAVPGVDVVGPLPDAIQKRAVFSGGVFADSQQPSTAREVLTWLSGPDLYPHYQRNGLQPASTA